MRKCINGLSNSHCISNTGLIRFVNKNYDTGNRLRYVDIILIHVQLALRQKVTANQLVHAHFGVFSLIKCTQSDKNKIQQLQQNKQQPKTIGMSDITMIS